MRLRQSSTVMRAMRFCSFVSDDLTQLALGGFEVFVNYTVFELGDVRQFVAGVCQAALDDALGILPAGAQAALELLEGGRHDKDADAVRMQLAHLPRALPVDLEEQVMTAAERIADHLLGRAVAVTMHLGALEELAAAAHHQELGVVDKMVFAAVLLAGSRCARGVGNGKLERRIFLQDRLDERALARAGGRGDDEQLAFGATQCSAPARALARRAASVQARNRISARWRPWRRACWLRG